MKKIISRTVIALSPGTRLIDDEIFRRIREGPPFFNVDEKYDQQEDTGGQPRPKKTVIPVTGVGSNDRQHNPGAGMGDDREKKEHKPGGVGSGYNDGEAANDETGPGNTPTIPDPYYASDVFNELFMDLSLKGGNRDYRQNVHNNLNVIRRSDPIMPKSRRYDVDTMNRN